jgi:hypothetical protein
MVAPTCFGITLPSSGSVPSAFWEMLNWGVVDRILWMGVLCVSRTTSLDTTYPSSIQLAWVASEVTTTPWWWQWLAETCWGKSRNALIKILLLYWHICWLFCNDTTELLGPTVQRSNSPTVQLSNGPTVNIPCLVVFQNILRRVSRQALHSNFTHDSQKSTTLRAPLFTKLK